MTPSSLPTLDHTWSPSPTLTCRLTFGLPGAFQNPPHTRRLQQGLSALCPESLWDSPRSPHSPHPIPLPIPVSLVVECCRRCLPGTLPAQSSGSQGTFLEAVLYVSFPCCKVQTLWGGFKAPLFWRLPVSLGAGPPTGALLGSPNPQAVSCPQALHMLRPPPGCFLPTVDLWWWLSVEMSLILSPNSGHFFLCDPIPPCGA